MESKGAPFSQVRAVRGDLPSKEGMALHWVESVVGMPLEGGLHTSLKSGEVLCDLVNTIRPGVVSRVTRMAVHSGMSEMRLAAKQRDNITRYLEACSFLDVRAADTFSTADLFDAKSLDSVVKNILALGRIAVTLDDYHGPTLGVAKGRVWEQPSASVGSRKDLPTGAVGSSKHLLVVGSEKEGATRSSRASAAALSEEEELARTLDVGSLDETGAALLWLSAVLEEDLQGQSLQQCLLSGGAPHISWHMPSARPRMHPRCLPWRRRGVRSY